MSARKWQPKLTVERKAKVLAEKDSGIFTVEKVAIENDITERTVYQIARDRAPEVVALAETFKEKMIAQAKRNVNVGLDVMHERMFDPTSKLSEITGAVKISHDIFRLETEQSTANIAHSTPDDVAAQYIQYLTRKHGAENVALFLDDPLMLGDGTTIDVDVLQSVAGKIDK